MNRDLKIAIGLLVGTIALFGVTVSRQNVDDYAARQLILTRDGCAYAQSIGLKAEQDKEMCVLLARFRPYVFSDGGVIVLDDDRKIIVTNNMVLTHRQSEANLPLTPEQQADQRWFWIWLAITATAYTATLIYAVGPWDRTKGKTK